MKWKQRQESFVKDCDWLFLNTIYHRGKFNNESVYENTMLAYKGAMDEGASIELDVQLTNDNKVVCFHDADLKRMFNRQRLLNDISYKRINKLSDKINVPLFSDVLKEINGKVGLVIELKHVNNKVNKRLLKEVYECLKGYEGKYVIVSFSPFMLKGYRRLDKRVYLGRNGTSICKGLLKRFLVSNLGFDFICKCDFVSYDVEHSNVKILSKYKDKGYKILGWVLRDNNEVELKNVYDNFIVE